MRIQNVVLFIFTLLLFSCGNLQSGHYVQWKSTDTVERVAHAYGISTAEIINLNRGKSFHAGEWIFIPEHSGLIQLFNSNLQYDNIASSSEFLKTGKFIWPVPSSTRVSSHYGMRWGRPHRGIDIPGRSGANIVAAEDGVVIYSGNGLKGYGNLVIVAHGGGLKTVYAHNKRNYVGKGQKVYRGQVIAKLGSTGHSTGPHLHFEIRRHDKAINPTAYVEQSRKLIVAYKK